MNYEIYTDGGARGNPGPGAIGVVIFNERKETVYELAKYLGICTNNQAEYVALVEALQVAKDKEFKSVKCFLDSQLIVYQLKGQYKIKNEQLKTYFLKVKDLEKSFESISYEHVRREKNKHADALVNKALDNNGC